MATQVNPAVDAPKTETVTAPTPVAEVAAPETTVVSKDASQ